MTASNGNGFPLEAQLEVEWKLARAREFMRSKGLDALLLGRADSFAWITAGGDSRCPSATDVGVASVLITPDGQSIITSNIEAERLRAETLAHVEPAGIFEFVVHPWFESSAGALGRVRGRLGADIPLPGTELVYPDVVTLRMPFTEWEAKRYSEVGRGVSDAVERACFRIEPGMTERAIAGMVASELMCAGFTPTVLLVGADRRAHERRHPLPTGQVLARYCMIVVCAHRGGLVVALTRSVHFGEPPAQLIRAHEAAARVHVVMIAATRPGAVYQDVLARAASQYEVEGYPDEWRFHHQGGPIGYQDRELLAVPGATRSAIQPPQAVAWNPSVPGAKSEDTLLVLENGAQVVTAASDRWPMVEVSVDGAVAWRPGILVR